MLGITEVTWLTEQHASTHAARRFVGSPSLVKSGPLWLASHDYFFDTPVGTVSVFSSADGGINWSATANISAIYWAQLFEHGGSVYLIGPSGDYSGEGDLKIARCTSSPCDGRDWTEAAVLAKGTPERHFHSAPTPVVSDGETLFRAMEVGGTSVPSGDLAVVMLSANASCPDLTAPGCWTVSPGLAWNASWWPHAVGRPARRDPRLEESMASTLRSGKRAWEEANAVVDAKGGVWAMVRLDGPLEHCPSVAECNGAALLSFDRTSGRLSFEAIVNLPTGCNKFAIRRSPADGMFYSLTNPVDADGIESGTCGQRNHAVLAQSADLRSWTTCATILYDDTGFQPADSVHQTGLQYIDFEFDGADIVAAVRAGYRGSVTYHDANRLLIKRVLGYASQCPGA